MTTTKHAHMDESAILDKPNDLSTSPPPRGSPMPPAASLGSVSAGPSSDAPSVHSNATTAASMASPSSSSAPNQVTAPPPEVEATLSKLTAHKNVTGCLVLTRPDALIIRAGGRDFEPSGPGAHDRSERLRRVVRMVKSAVEGLGASVGEVDEGDELSFLRIRTKQYEMMISPSEKYLLVVLQDPSITP
ncbi:hypothetical protein BCV69DRAFT_283985 [Microstroma glucosiphilum]|uniref:Roadblock/LAMTOR2 domain-containing protein n=1 Tax=Pseudomicrostroma glucosiphilum TaxID=1684307 RepID=A0A316U2B8_9BASI|nr:hypothetical protein BCV69DRAFT_283985 [Pseudomicrostroma glucosiphilum]PWN19350.1 hypothetical protein BCV69DRAFT_283985 [Pseudomicrostroma glucosiphilum]